MGIYEALAKCKKDFKPIYKESDNPFFKSKYADLETIKEAIDEAIDKHGFIVLSRVENGCVTTSIVLIETNEKIESSFPLTPNLDAQKKGSEITYGRRYNLQALLDLVAEDDDGNGASKKVSQSKIDLDKIETWLKSKRTVEALKQSKEKWEGLGPQFEKDGMLAEHTKINEVLAKKIKEQTNA